MECKALLAFERKVRQIDNPPDIFLCVKIPQGAGTLGAEGEDLLFPESNAFSKGSNSIVVIVLVESHGGT